MNLHRNVAVSLLFLASLSGGGADRLGATQQIGAPLSALPT
jgi:hypothetical protein